MYTCTKVISATCSTGCDDKVFGYDIFGCTVAFDSDILIQGWDFGDGNTSTMVDPTHTYTTSGDYTVVFELLSSERCEKTIRVGCDTTPPCCTAAFSSVATRNCSVLNLSLNAECMEAGAGSHSWAVTATQPGACINLVNFSTIQPMQGMIQVTNIDNAIPQRECFEIRRNYSLGIVFSRGEHNTSTCNDVRSNVSNSFLHSVRGNPNGLFARNKLEGGRYSAIFQGDCNSSIFACNNMIDYSENGLRYIFGAETSAQGNPFTMTRGNKWYNGNGVAVDAFIDDPVSNPLLSNYYVRNQPNENPITNVGPGWFFANVTSAPDCYLECPIIQSPPEFHSLEITTRDSMVANGEMTFNYYPEASIRLAEFQLLHKLLSCDTFEMVDNVLMNGFVEGFVGTPVYTLVGATQNLVDAGKFTNEQRVLAENYLLEINQLLSEISVVDSLMKITVDTAVQAVYQANLMDLQSDLSAVQSQYQELVSNKYLEFHSVAAEVLEGVNALVPDHIFEVNTQTVLRAYLENVILGYQPEQSTLEALHAIATQCVYTAGPSVGNAQGLYERFTGDFLPESDCDGLFEREIKSQNKLKQVLGAVLVYPNPTNGLVYIDLAEFDTESTYQAEFINMFGQTNFGRTLHNPRNQIQIGDLPNGIYQLRILKNRNDIVSKLISIQN